MRALAKLVSVNNPDKILFVGEALVGNEAVDQLTKFDRALKDFSSASGAGKGRGIDGMLVTKWDTVDDKVCNSFSLQSYGLSRAWAPVLSPLDACLHIAPTQTLANASIMMCFGRFDGIHGHMLTTKYDF